MNEPRSDELRIEAGEINAKAAAIERLAAALRDQAAALRELQAAEACYESERPRKIPPGSDTTAEGNRETIERTATQRTRRI